MSILIDANAEFIRSAADDSCAPNPTRPGAVSGWFRAAFNPATDTTNRILCSFKVLSGGFNNWFRVMKSSGKKWTCGFQINGVSSENTSTPDVAITQDTWFHMCVTWGPGTATTLYINGTAITLSGSSHPSATFSGTGSTSMAWTMGSWYDTGSEHKFPFNGHCAEFAVFGDTLTAAQVGMLADGRSPTAIGASLLTYWPCKPHQDIDLMTGRPGACGTVGAITSAGTWVLDHPTVDEPWAAIIKPTANALRSVAVERLIEWAGQTSNSGVWVFDRPVGSTSIPNAMGLTECAPDGTNPPTLASMPGLPGDPGSCAFFDGTNDFASIAHATWNNYERTDSFTIIAAIKIPQNLSNGTYAIASKTLAGANATGWQFFVNKDANGTRLVGRIGNTLTDAIEQKTGDATVPTGRWTMVAMRVTTASTPTIELFVDGIKRATTNSTIIGTADNNALAATIQNTAAIFVGKEVTAASGKFFSGFIKYLAVIKTNVSYNRLAALGTLTTNDVPDLYVKDAQGNIHRPGDDGYKPNLIIDTDADDDRGDAMAMEMAAGYVDAGLCNIKAFLVGQRYGHTYAAAVPGAIKKLRKLTAPIGCWQSTDIGGAKTPIGALTNASTITAGANSIQTLYPSLVSGVTTECASYAPTLTTFINAVTDLPDKSVVYCMIGHGSVLAEILNDATAGPLFASKVAYVVGMFGDYSPATDGTLFHSDSFDGAGNDGEFNVTVGETGSGQPAEFVSLLADLTTAEIPLVVIGWNGAARNGSTLTIPLASRIMGYLTNSVAKAAADAQGATTDGRTPWDQFAVHLACHGPTRTVNGGFEWGLRGAISVNTGNNTLIPGYGEGYTRLTPSPLTGYHWFLWFDDAADATDISPVIVAHMDRYIPSVETGGAIGDRVARRRTYIPID